MAKNKKPKFLEKETPELLALLKETLSADEVDEKKALKITEELISRLPAEEGPISVDEALKAAAEVMTEALNKVKGAYDNEIAMMEDSDGEDEAEAEDDEDEEEEAPKPKKSKKDAKEEKPAKKSKKKPEPEPEEEEDDSDEDDSDEDDGDDEDYSDWSTKDLKKECRTRGIKVTKGMAKADMVKALEADDKE